MGHNKRSADSPLGERVRSLFNGSNNSEIAVQLNCHGSTVHTIVSAGIISDAMADRICERFSCDKEWLLYGDQKKELRGQDAIEYAKRLGGTYLCLMDEEFLIQAESKHQNRTLTDVELDELLREMMEQYDDLESTIPGSPTNIFLINRYGYDWIYVPIQGNHPLEEETAVLGLFKQHLDEDGDSYADVCGLAASQPAPFLRDTGFSKWAEPDLVFQAALRLVHKGLLRSIPDSDSTWGVIFGLPPELKVNIDALLCLACKYSSDGEMHLACAERLFEKLKSAIGEYKKKKKRDRKSREKRPHTHVTVS